jgi:hypothetical protein
MPPSEPPQHVIFDLSVILDIPPTISLYDPIILLRESRAISKALAKPTLTILAGGIRPPNFNEKTSFLSSFE